MGKAARAWLALMVGLALFHSEGSQAGVRAPPDPARDMNLIVVATVEQWHSFDYAGWEQHSLRLKVSETLKGSPGESPHLTVEWVPQLPAGCDTDPCYMVGWTPPPRPGVGDRVIACLRYVSPERTIAWQEFVYAYSEPKRRELVKQIEELAAKE